LSLAPEDESAPRGTLPFRTAELIRRLARDRISQRLFITYAAIGGLVMVIYLALFAWLVSLRTPLLIATSAAYFTATAVHFTLNRYTNFRRFDRSGYDQARTFVTVIGAQWLITLAVVNFLSTHGVRPTVAALIATIVNFPIGFLAHRYLTFGVGIVPRILRIRNSQNDSAS